MVLVVQCSWGAHRAPFAAGVFAALGQRRCQSLALMHAKAARGQNEFASAIESMCAWLTNAIPSDELRIPKAELVEAHLRRASAMMLHLETLGVPLPTVPVPHLACGMLPAHQPVQAVHAPLHSSYLQHAGAPCIAPIPLMHQILPFGCRLPAPNSLDAQRMTFHLALRAAGVADSTIADLFYYLWLQDPEQAMAAMTGVISSESRVQDPTKTLMDALLRMFASTFRAKAPKSATQS